MARLNIEEKLWSRLPRLSRKLGWSEEKVLGKLAFFWHDTQEDEVHTCSKLNLVDYLRLDDESEDEIDLVISVLVQAKILRKINEDSYEIAGNKKQIETIAAYNSKIERMNEKRLEKMRGKTKNNRLTQEPLEESLQDALEDVYQEPLQEVHQEPPKQCNSKQSKAMHGRENSVAPPLKFPDKIPINPESIVDLYNKHLGGVGKLKHVGGFGMLSSGRAFDDLKISLGYLPTLEDWEKLFLEIKTRPKLIGTDKKFTCLATILWVVKHDNIKKVYAGTFDSTETNSSMTPEDWEDLKNGKVKIF